MATTVSEENLNSEPLYGRYLDLVEAFVTGSRRAQEYSLLQFEHGSWRAMLLAPVAALLKTKNYHLFRKLPGPAPGSADRPQSALTMVGHSGIANVRHCLEEVLRNNVPGDFIETGVWRGGTCIFAKALLDAAGSDRKVWVADSFQGVPPPHPDRYPADVGSGLHKCPEIAVSFDEVVANFEQFGILDDRVQFLRGWFCETLPSAPIKQLAVLRLDGDLYESTWDALSHLYSKLSAGGYCIVDDYQDLAACTKAVTDFRAKHGIVEEIHPVDASGEGGYWRKS